jgi:hypothetical protein
MTTTVAVGTMKVAQVPGPGKISRLSSETSLNRVHEKCASRCKRAVSVIAMYSQRKVSGQESSIRAFRDMKLSASSMRPALAFQSGKRDNALAWAGTAATMVRVPSAVAETLSTAEIRKLPGSAMTAVTRNTCSLLRKRWLLSRKASRLSKQPRSSALA